MRNAHIKVEKTDLLYEDIWDRGDGIVYTVRFERENVNYDDLRDFIEASQKCGILKYVSFDNLLM